MEVLTFNCVSLSEYGAYWSGAELFDTAEKDVSFYSVPGRNGDLIIYNDRFQNKNINVNCFIRENFKTNFTNLMNYLYSQEGYGRIETTTESDVFYQGSFVKSISPNTGAFLKYGSFTLQFNVKPQKFLKSGEIATHISSSSSLENPTLYVAKPLLGVTGTGKIVINESEITLNANTSTTYIDCEIEDAYEGTINRNKDIVVVNGFPKLKVGTNNITTNGCEIVLYPRWWRL